MLTAGSSVEANGSSGGESFTAHRAHHHTKVMFDGRQSPRTLITYIISLFTRGRQHQKLTKSAGLSRLACSVILGFRSHFRHNELKNLYNIIMHKTSF